MHVGLLDIFQGVILKDSPKYSCFATSFFLQGIDYQYLQHESVKKTVFKSVLKHFGQVLLSDALICIPHIINSDFFFLSCPLAHSFIIATAKR